MKEKKTNLNELKTIVEQVIKEESKKYSFLSNSHSIPRPQDIVNSLSKIDDDGDIFNICYAIAPDSVAAGWSRNQLLDIIYDVLRSRF
ncbi:MAG: hypothetical protein WC466_06885 [Candidatus Izemoplasmatales bacterium]